MRTPEEVNNDLVDQLIARTALRRLSLIEAFRATPRHRFIERLWLSNTGQWRDLDFANLSEEDLRTLYSDRALTTKLSASPPSEAPVAVSSSSQPSLMAQMLEDLALTPGMRVLEIGAGTGYNAALLAHVVGEVVSIDIDRDVLEAAQRHLAAFPDRRVQFHHADGRFGWPTAAPYDRIQVTAATEDLEPAWLEQLRPGGIVQAPLDLAPGLAWIVQGSVNDGVFMGKLTRPAYFMPLRDEGAAGRDRALATGPLPGPDRLQSVTAPYANWPDRRWSADICEFLPSVALLAWLEGHALGYATCPDGRPGFGIGDLVRGQACWLGPYQWRISGKGGEEMALTLWRRWLELGGPRVEDWCLHAAAAADRLPQPTVARLSLARQGPRVAQRWQLP